MFEFLSDLKVSYRSLKNQKQIRKYYVGELNKKTKLPNGFGTCIKKYIKYTGEWVNGLPNGIGISIFENISNNYLYYDINNLKYDIYKYEGEIKNGLLHGKGILKKNNKLYYDGSFNNGYLTGNGRFYYNNKIIYKGEILNGKFNGEGILYDKNNYIIYSGNWKNGLKEGYGKYFNLAISKTIPEYDGYWMNNLYHGTGTLITKYYKRIGIFKFNQQTDEGIYEDEYIKYKGTFKNNLFNGEGNFSFYYDKKNNKTSFTYIGNFVDNKRNGHGFIQYNNNDTYTGNFFDGLKHDKGIYYDSKNNYTIDTVWDKDRKNGSGTITYNNGTGFKCIWNDNKLISKKRLIFYEGDNLELTFMKKKEIPSELYCPISLELMKDPIICSDGHTYDKTSIIELFKNKNFISPTTREKLDINILIPNYNIKKLIDNIK